MNNKARPANKRSAKGNARAKKRRRKGVRLSGKGVALIAAVLAVTVGVVLSLTVLFPVNSIKVSGNTVYTADEVIKASGITSGENVILSGRKAEQNICRLLPYISKVDVGRSLSGTVTLKVTETKATAAFIFANKYAITDGTKVLEIADKLPDGMMLVYTAVTAATPGSNIELSEEVSESYNALLQSLKKSGIGSITRIEMTSAVGIKLIYDDRLVLEVGTISDVDKKLQHAATVIDEAERKYGKDVEGTIKLKWVGSGGNDSYFKQHKLTSSDLSVSTSSDASSDYSSVATGGSPVSSSGSTVTSSPSSSVSSGTATSSAPQQSSEVPSSSSAQSSEPLSSENSSAQPQ